MDLEFGIWDLGFLFGDEEVAARAASAAEVGSGDRVSVELAGVFEASAAGAGLEGLEGLEGD